MNEKSKKQQVKRSKYNPEFKGRALLRAETEGIAQVAKDLGITEIKAI